MRSRPFSSAQRWDLGLLLAMFTVFCLVLTAVVSLRAVPLLVAAEPKAVSAAPPAILPEPRLAPTLEFLPEAQPRLAVLSPAPAAAPQRQAPDIQVYQGKKFRFVKTLSVRVTAYAPDPRCCYPYNGTTTASGLPVTANGGNLVAADTSVIPMHSLVIVPGYARGAAVPVLDRGAAIKGRRLDVLLPSFAQAQTWGVRSLEVKVFAPMK